MWKRYLVGNGVYIRNVAHAYLQRNQYKNRRNLHEIPAQERASRFIKAYKAFDMYKQTHTYQTLTINRDEVKAIQETTQYGELSIIGNDNN